MPDELGKRFADFVMEKLKLGAELVSPGPNMDPDYHEFWAEAHPRLVKGELPSVGDPTFDELIPPPTLGPWLAANGWSEEIYHDIGPGWSEVSPIQALMGRRPDIKDAKGAFVVSTRWPEEHDAFYRALYNSLRVKMDSA